MCKQQTAKGSVEDPDEGKPVALDDAIELTGLGWFHIKLTLCTGLCYCALMFNTISLAYVLPGAECDFQMRYEDKGILTAAPYIGMIFFSFVWGSIADLKGRRNVISLTLLGDAIASISSSFAPNFWTFFVLRFISGIFLCAPPSISVTYLGEFNSNKNRTQAILMVGVLTASSTIFIPAIAWLILPNSFTLQITENFAFNEWRLFVLICTIPSCVAITTFRFFLPESPKYLYNIGDYKGTLKILANVYAQNKRTTPDKYPVKSLIEDGKIIKQDNISFLNEVKNVALKAVPLFKPPYLPYTILTCFLQYGLFACCNGIVIWIPELFNLSGSYLRRHPNESLSFCHAIDTELSIKNNLTLFNNNIINTTIYDFNGTTTTNKFQNCQIHLEIEMFYNAIIIGGASSLCYLLIGYALNYLQKIKKHVFVSIQLLSALFGFLILFLKSEDLILAAFCLFIGFAGVSVTFLTGIVIDIYPTSLRATAISVSLMMARTGTVSASVIIGLLLNISCDVTFYIVAGIVLLCGIFSTFLPISNKVRPK